MSTLSPDRALRYLGLTEKAAADLLAASDPAGLVEDLFERIRTELGLDVFFNYSVRPGEGLVLETSGGLSDAQAKAAGRLDLGQAVCGCVALDGKPVHAASIQTSKDPQLDFVREVGLDCYACTPLLADGRVTGTLGFGRRSTPCFDADELHFLHTLCGYVALAKQRLATERALQEALETKERLYQELNHRVRNSLQLVLSLLSIETARAQPVAHPALRMANDRIRIVAAVHQRLYNTPESAGVEISGLLAELLEGVLREAHDSPPVSLTTRGRPRLGVEQAVALALLFDEVLRRSLGPHPRVSAQGARLFIDGEQTPSGLRIECETGALGDWSPPASDDRVVQALLRQVRGTLETNSEQRCFRLYTAPARSPVISGTIQ